MSVTERSTVWRASRKTGVARFVFPAGFGGCSDDRIRRYRRPRWHTSSARRDPRSRRNRRRTHTEHNSATTIPGGSGRVSLRRHTVHARRAPMIPRQRFAATLLDCAATSSAAWLSDGGVEPIANVADQVEPATSPDRPITMTAPAFVADCVTRTRSALTSASRLAGVGSPMTTVREEVKMFRTGRIARNGHVVSTWLRELRLPPPERRAARAERAAERQMRRERDSQRTAERRAAAAAAERGRQENKTGFGGYSG